MSFVTIISLLAPRRVGRTAVGISLLPVCGALTMAVTVPVFARQPSDPTLYDVHPTYKEGDINRYRLEFHTKMNNPRAEGKEIDFYFSTTMKETTKQVKPDGVATLIDAPEEAYVKFGELEMDATQALPVVTQTRGKDGAIQSFTTKGGDPKIADLATLLQKFAQAPTLLYPPKPVKVGDSWKIDYTDAKEKKMMVTGTATLVGVEMIKGAQSLKISIVTDTKASDQGDVQMHMEGSGNIDRATGHFLYMKAALNGTMGRFGKNKSDLTLNLVIPGEKPAEKSAGTEAGAKP